MLIQTWGQFPGIAETFLQRRGLPWKIGQQTTYYWLSRAELNIIDPTLAGGLTPIADSGPAIFKALTGRKQPGLNVNYRNTYDSLKTYQDLPKTGSGRNRYQDWLAGPKPWDLAVEHMTPAQLAAAFSATLNEINALPNIPPDDPSRMNDTRCLNDKKNLRGLQYLLLMSWLKEPLNVGSRTVPRLTGADRETFMMFKSQKRFTGLFRFARTILMQAGLGDY